MKKITKNIILCVMLVSLLLSFGGCDLASDVLSDVLATAAPSVSATAEPSVSATEEPSQESTTTPSDDSQASGEDITFTVDWSDTAITIPAFSGDYYIEVNDYVPFFEEEDLVTYSYEYYSPLDALGRCEYAIASVGVDIMPTEDRGSISSVYPTGWEQNQYDFVDATYIYNRCHIIGFQLTGENANKLNLITGTRAMNVEGMLPFENMVADYVQETENHVIYRVTPIFEGDDLLCIGVLMEAISVEDDGEGVQFNVFCYNAQLGVTFDYATGKNYANGEEPEEEDTVVLAPENEDEVVAEIDTNANGTITIAEAESAGYEMPITSDHWLYQYMTDADGDGKVG